MPNELELIALETEFELYLGFTKRLALDLPDTNARTRAALWLQKLRSTTNDNFKKLRNEHLKLLLFALHRRAMVGIFEKPPPEELECFHDGLTLTEMTRELIEITEKAKLKGDNEDDPTKCPLPSVSTNLSFDLREYAATQNIPLFGAHIYYAVSTEPMQFWQKPPGQKYPGMGDVPNSQEWENSLSMITDNVLKRMAEKDAQIQAAKEAEEAGGEAEDGKMGGVDFSKKIDVDLCPPIKFKWKKDSILNTHQNYDFSDVGIAEDLENQGVHQLEEDEKALSLMDVSLPGRQRLVVRDPFYKGLPSDFKERLYHGVAEEVSPLDESEMICSKYCKESCDQNQQATNPCGGPTQNNNGSNNNGNSMQTNQKQQHSNQTPLNTLYDMNWKRGQQQHQNNNQQNQNYNQQNQNYKQQNQNYNQQNQNYNKQNFNNQQQNYYGSGGNYQDSCPTQEEHMLNENNYVCDFPKNNDCNNYIDVDSQIKAANKKIDATQRCCPEHSYR